MRIDEFNTKNDYLNGRHDSTLATPAQQPFTQNQHRRSSSGYHSSVSDQATLTVPPQNGYVKKSEDSRKVKNDLKNVKSRVDTGLGVKKSLSGTKLAADTPHQLQKRSEPIVARHRKNSATFKVPDLPVVANNSSAGGNGGVATTFNRNIGNRRSLTRLFSRNDKDKKSDRSGSAGSATAGVVVANGCGSGSSTGGGGGEIRTPFGGSFKESSEEEESASGSGAAATNNKRSNFLSKRSLTSLSLFSKKDEKDEKDEEIPAEPKERKNSISRLRAARSSLDLSSLGFGSIS